eukprot:scaffold308_cov327-Pavlova_lutheri.AAC.30
MAWMKLAPVFATFAVSLPNERSPMTGFFGLVSTSTTGAKSRSMWTARSSSASTCPAAAAAASALPADPSTRAVGTWVNPLFSLAILPPS